jgi:hypothetical protein
MSKQLTFDEVFLIWLKAEIEQIEGRDILSVAKDKGFNSIVEWRLATALRLGLDTKEWHWETFNNPAEQLPDIIIGPYQGWSKFFDNKIDTTFAQALEIPEFFEWCKTHDRVVPLSQNFPLSTTIILFRLPNGQLIHIEGGHRICAAAYANKIGQPINFSNRKVTAAIADVGLEEIPKLIEFMTKGTFKQ